MLEVYVPEVDISQNKQGGRVEVAAKEGGDGQKKSVLPPRFRHQDRISCDELELTLNPCTYICSQFPHIQV
jgi:hypothetical protein